MKKKFLFIILPLLLLIATSQAQTTVYDINDWDLNAAGYSVTTVVNGVTIIPGATTNTGAVDTGAHTFTDGYMGNRRLKTNGSSYNNTPYNPLGEII